jgi:hypothetical protein
MIATEQALLAAAPKPSRLARWLPLRRLWPLLVVAGAFIGPASNPIGLPDIWWTLQSGAWMVEHGALLVSDPFTSAPATSGPVYNVQWLAQLIYFGFFHLGGLELVIAATAAAIALTYALVLGASVVASGHLRLACLSVAIGYLLAFSNLSPRPQTLAYPIFAVFVLAVVRAEWRRDTRVLWCLPALTVAWANLHGSFFAGWLLLGCAATGRALTERSLRAALPYLAALLGCCLASLVTPFGPGSLAYLASMGSNPIVRDLVTEWAPTSVTFREGCLFFLSLAGVIALALRARVRLTLTELLWLAVFGWLAISSVRAIVWWGLVLAPIATRLLGSLVVDKPVRAHEKPVLNLIVATAILGMLVASLPWLKADMPLLPEDKRALVSAADTPVQVSEYLRTNPPPPGRVFTHLAWGGYFDWASWPTFQPFLDGRIEIHPPRVWLDYLTITFPGAEWRSLLDQYEVSTLVLDRSAERDLAALAAADPAWRQTYEDDLAVVFVRA